MELTQAQVSKILGCKPQFTLSLCKRGKLFKSNSGRKSRIDSDALSLYISTRLSEINVEQTRLVQAQENLSKHLLTTDTV